MAQTTQKFSIQSFPNELLSKIFIEAAAEDPEISCLSRQLVPKKHDSGFIFVRSARWLRSTTNIALSHVSHTFRIIAIDTPELWANVSNLQRKEELEVYLRRSKQAGLGIHLLIDDPKFKFKDHDANLRGVAVPQDFMNAIIPHAHRWVGFEFKTGKWINFFMQSVPKDMSAICKGLELPRLRSLSLSYPSPRYFGAEGLGLTELDQSEMGLTKDFRFYETWNTPNLKHLSTTWHIPKATPSTRSLQSISINLGSTTYYHVWDDRPLMTLLPLFVQLRRLSLRVGETAWDKVCETRPRLELPSLDVFVLHTQTMDYFRTELQCLIMPNVKSMQIECRPIDTGFNDEEEEDEDDRFIIYNWILRLFNEENGFQNLECLRLTFQKVGEYGDQISAKHTSIQHIFSAIFMRFPNLHHLYFEAPFTNMRNRPSRKAKKRSSNKKDEEPRSLLHVRAPLLRTLTFQNCPSLCAEDINDVVQGLKDGMDFERLVVNWCTSAKKYLVEGVISKDKLFWKDSAPDVDILEKEAPSQVNQLEDEDSDPDDRFHSEDYYDSDNVSSAADLSDFDVSVSDII
ncbi:hypothetical protein SCHPADRAFT_910046 [Schizopora paradoxa]|uniref:F-box domain-containing protein n=1 Tax=Schizopora paradoxa TaxID=27342 RepID=A0A0H2R4N3_9AGAM|nr:hypothetical protein SCHPADRAFT_910046 [Schizopora paradoxa]